MWFTARYFCNPLKLKKNYDILCDNRYATRICVTDKFMKILIDDALIQRLISEACTKRFTVSDTLVKGLSLELRPSGHASWRFRFTCFHKQECISLGSLSDINLKEARVLANALRVRILMGENPVCSLRGARPSGCPTFNEFVDQWYLPYINTYKKCVTADITLLTNHLIPAFGRKKLDAITRQDVLSFQQEKLDAGYKPAYINRFLVLLGYCFNLSIKWEIHGINKNPVRLVSLLKANNKIERFLGKEETLRLMNAIDQSPNPLLRYFVSLALLTGLRKREILDAQWKDVDFDRCVWVIPHSKSGYLRRIPITNDTKMILAELRERLPEILLCEPRLENPWVIPNWRTGKPFQSIFNSWDSARKKAEVPDVRIHDLRHSFASALVNQGVPIYDVQKLLGHQNVKTTERYAHVSMDRLRESAAVLGQFYDLSMQGEL